MPPRTTPLSRLALVLAPLAPALLALTFLASCADESEGEEDTLLTGFSLVVIVVLGILLVRWLARRNR